jgi:L-threonylcarbamoyladenylate synthase
VNVSELSIEEACQRIASGQAVAFPTVCGYGYALDPFLAGAEAMMSRLKPDRSDPVGLIAGDLQAVESLVEDWSQAARRCAESWPGELTVVLRAVSGLPTMIVSELGGVAVRIPDGSVARALARRYGSALTATSLNQTGQKPAQTIAELAPFSSVLAGYLAGSCASDLPSTLVDTLVDPPQVLRAGTVVLPWL